VSDELSSEENKKLLNLLKKHRYLDDRYHSGNSEDAFDHLDKNTQRRIISESRKYFWDSPYLFKLGNVGVMRRCVPREERLEILRKCHSAEYGGHYSHFRTQAKVWSSGFYWPEMHEDTKRYVASCPECQRTENISQRNSMPLKYNLQIDLFGV
jgi:hypothetical protein